ncbi:MAG: M20 family metallopeptidase [Rhodobacteraceae bacterium]|nr:M20 family metallopeptidase [Paracoccaceae bacterium]
MPVVNRIAEFAKDIAAWRRHLHAHPELGLDCHQTAAFVVQRLREMGVDEIHEGIAQTGVVAMIRGQGAGPTTGLRADMDALPMQEATGVEHASTVAGRMHACGHDGHTAMLLGAARYLSETRKFSGSVALIFQPAEETIGGGRIMVEEGMMERFGIDEVYALHTDPFAPLGEFRTRSGPLMAAVDDWQITVTGFGGHAAYPNTCRDPMMAALGIGQALQTIVSRNSDPLDPLVVSITQIHGGSAMNITPETVTLSGTVRSFSAANRDLAETRMTQIVEGQAAAFGVVGSVAYQRNYPPTINHDTQTVKAADVAEEIVGADRVTRDYPPEMGAEDFSYMLERRPGAFLFLGQGIGPSVHHPEFDFNDEAAPIGASFFARLIERLQPVS